MTPFKGHIIHCVGIGGIGMSGLAEWLHRSGHHVRGSDNSENANVMRLRACGIEIAIGHEAKNVKDASVIVHSAAIAQDNKELQKARQMRIPIITRATMLAELMRFKRAIAIAGAHGKTTTTALLASILEPLSPTVINGGVVEAWGSNVRMGEGDYIIVEADESDGSFMRYHPECAIVTNMDEEHLDHYLDRAHICDIFRDFIKKIPFYGCAILNADSAMVQEVIGDFGYEIPVLSYGLKSLGDVRATDIRPCGMGMRFGVRSQYDDFDVTLPMVGMHNVSNALGAIACALHMGVASSVIAQGVKNFGGVRRRFENVGMSNKGVLVVDDYAHHPSEIKATLAAARSLFKDRQLIAVHQPHRYSRLTSLFGEFCASFNDANVVIIADVYAAGEHVPDQKNGTKNGEKNGTKNGDDLVDGLKRIGYAPGDVLKLNDPAELPALISSIAHEGSVVICMGAGSIGGWARALVQSLNAQEGVA